ncbi:MAG: universal stress protein [Verrucomicrobiales bacterium]|nr:universal stress protein [Verrucomicrobiales bacterium]
MENVITQILVPLEPSECTRASSLRAACIAKDIGGEVTGLTVVDVAGIEDEVALPLRADLRAYPNPRSVELIQYSKKELEAVREEFESCCGEFSAPNHTLALKGCPGARIIGESRFHDLVVMGLKTNFHFATEGDSNDTLERVIDLLPTPLWLVPKKEIEPIEKVAIAYDGSLPATRALHHFLSLARLWDPEIRIFAADLKSGNGERLLSQTKAFLAAHGIEKVTTQLRERPIEEVFDDSLLSWSDLIVAGASSKSVLREFFVGSFMKKLIREADCNLFVSS